MALGPNSEMFFMVAAISEASICGTNAAGTPALAHASRAIAWSTNVKLLEKQAAAWYSGLDAVSTEKH